MSAFGATALARKKTTRREPDPEPEKWLRQPFAVQVRGTPEWKEWVEELAEYNRQKVAGLVDTALARLAKEIGFRDPPKR